MDRWLDGWVNKGMSEWMNTWMNTWMFTKQQSKRNYLGFFMPLSGFNSAYQLGFPLPITFSINSTYLKFHGYSHEFLEEIF